MRQGAPLSGAPRLVFYRLAPWHFLNFLPLPQGLGSLRPTPAYGLGAVAPIAGGGPFGGSGPVAVSGLTSPSAAALLATMGVDFLGAPPSGAVTVCPGREGRGGGGPSGICSLSQRSANVPRTSGTKPTNVSSASCL